MKLGYARVSKADGSQVLDLQHDALAADGVLPENIYDDKMSGAKADRPGLIACLRALREGDTLVVWKLDRLGRSLSDLIETVQDLEKRGVNFKVLMGHGAQIDTSTASGKLIFSIFAAMAEFERAQLSERTKAGLEAAKKRGRVGGRKRVMTDSKIAIAKAAMAQPDCNVSALCRELGVSRATLYRHVPAAASS